MWALALAPGGRTIPGITTTKPAGRPSHRDTARTRAGDELAVSEAQPRRTRSPLWRLMPLIRQHGWAFWGGMFFICLGRTFEAAMPLVIRLPVNRLTAHDYDLLIPVLSILGLAYVRYFCVAHGRKLVRLVGVTVTYNMRERLYWHFELLGPRFFARFPTGDLMARAINDLGRGRRRGGGAARARGGRGGAGRGAGAGRV